MYIDSTEYVGPEGQLQPQYASIAQIPIEEVRI